MATAATPLPWLRHLNSAHVIILLSNGKSVHESAGIQWVDRSGLHFADDVALLHDSKLTAAGKRCNDDWLLYKSTSTALAAL